MTVPSADKLSSLADTESSRVSAGLSGAPLGPGQPVCTRRGRLPRLRAALPSHSQPKGLFPGPSQWSDHPGTGVPGTRAATPSPEQEVLAQQLPGLRHLRPSSPPSCAFLPALPLPGQLRQPRHARPWAVVLSLRSLRAPRGGHLCPAASSGREGLAQASLVLPACFWETRTHTPTQPLGQGADTKDASPPRSWAISPQHSPDETRPASQRHRGHQPASVRALAHGQAPVGPAACAPAICLACGTCSPQAPRLSWWG